MTDTLTPVLTAHWDQPDAFTLDGYGRTGGYRALRKALGMSRGEVIEVVKNSGLRGRGGAGCRAGRSGRRRAASPGARSRSNWWPKTRLRSAPARRAISAKSCG